MKFTFLLSIVIVRAREWNLVPITIEYISQEFINSKNNKLTMFWLCIIFFIINGKGNAILQKYKANIKFSTLNKQLTIFTYKGMIYNQYVARLSVSVDFFLKKDISSKLNFNAVERCVFNDISGVIEKLKNKSSDIVDDFEELKNDDFRVECGVDSNFLFRVFETYDGKDFDEFFTRLGSNRSKELINLFLKLKTRVSNSVFETEVFSFYMCIKDTSLINLLYFNNDDVDKDGYNCFDCVVPTLDQQFKIIKKFLKLKLGDFGVFV
uniref:P52 family lipoprotein n=1 Tax=Borreliella tanukii TaxID=56146 RepID=UPI003B21C039